MPTLTCPDVQTFQRLLRGELPSPEVESVAQHLEGCGACVQTVQALQGDDTFVEMMREVRLSGGDGPEADLVHGLMDRLEGLRQLVTASGMAADTALADRELTDFLAPAQGPDEIGRLGPYRILKVLGGGGMGVVFLAEDVQLQRRVALKAMKPALAASASARQRFLREARATATLAHERIVSIYHVGEDRGIPFLAMHLLQGETLDDRLQREGKLPLAEVLRIAREVTEGLTAAHERGLIHRDIKPGNIWLEKLATEITETTEGKDKNDSALLSVPSVSSVATFRVKLLDFGLARATDDDTRLTQTGLIVGTPQYMAPEQAAGEAIDHRCDLFSLGCVLYRMCTGEQAFQGANVRATLRAVETQQPRPAHERNPDVPPALSDLIARLLAKKPANRPASAQEVVRALEVIERNPAAPPQSKRRQLLAWAGIAAALLIVLAVPAYLFVPPVREFAAVVVRFATNKGELVIEADDDDIEIVIKQAGKEPVVEVVQKKTKRRFVLTAVDGEILAEDKESGMRVKTTEFQLARGGRQTFSAQVLLADKPEAGFRPLFNGKDLTGWKVVNHPDTPRGAVTWSVADKALTTAEEGLQGFIHTAKAYENYVLQLEFRFPKLVDPDLTPAAGILLHLNDPQQKDPPAHEIALATKGRFALHPVGGARGGEVIADIASLPAGKWHRLKVTCEQGRMEVIINGKWGCNLRAYEPTKGFIAFQNRGPDVQFRNVQIKELPPPLFHLFNGKDLTGWEGQTEAWAWKDGVLESGKTKEGLASSRIWTSNSFKDFELSFQVEYTDTAGVSFRGQLWHGKELKTPAVDGLEVYLGRETVNLGLNVAGKFTTLDRGDQDKVKNLMQRFNVKYVTIRCVGMRVTVRLNGDTIIDEEVGPHIAIKDRGIIALRNNGGKTVFRNIQFQELQPPPAKDDAKLFQGTWKAVSGEENGEALEADDLRRIRFTFEGESFRLQSHMLGGNDLRGVFTLNSAKNPKEIFILSKDRPTEGKSWNLRGIYQLEDDRLTICLGTTDKEQITEFKTKDAGTPRLLVVLRPEPAFQPLFNGRDLTGWAPEVKGVDPKLSWEVKDKVLQTKGLLRLRTERTYENFELKFEWRARQDLEPDPMRVSQVAVHLFLEGQSEREPERKPAYIELAMDTEGKVIARPVAPGAADAAQGDWFNDRFKPAEWNRVSLTCKGGIIRVNINDRDLGMFAYSKPTKGFIGLRGTLGPRITEFRNIEIKELPPTPPPAEPAFQPLFNGKDLDGWNSKTDGYFVKKDGSLLATPVPNEYSMLRTLKSYENYELRMQLRADKQGAGGLQVTPYAAVALHVTNVDSRLEDLRYGVAIKLAGGRAPDVRVSGRDVGEVRISGNTAGPVSGWKPESWSDLRIVCQDKRITVFFNGEEKWSCSRCVPSKGHIGLWAYSGDAHFRNIEIKELPPSPPEPAFQPLFNGKDLDGWERLGEHWGRHGEALVGTAPAKPLSFYTHLCSPKKYRDFELKFEVWIKDDDDSSGVVFRGEVTDRQRFTVRGPMVRFGQGRWGDLASLDFGDRLNPKPDAKVTKVLKKNDFNEVQLRCVGKRVTIQVNGETTVDGEFPKTPDEGIFAFRLPVGEGVEVRFRNVRLKEYPKE